MSAIDTRYIEEAITEQFGERCPEFNEGCHCCRAWRELDTLKASTKEYSEFTRLMGGEREGV